MNKSKMNNNKNSILPLSKIHRLIRPLKSSIKSLKQSFDQIQNNHQNNQIVQTYYYPRSKANKDWIQDNQDYYESIRKKSNRKRYTKTNQSYSSKRNTNPISSPIFNGFQNNSGSNRSKNQRNHLNTSPSNSKDHLQLEIQTKIDKTILAYKNILDATLHNDQCSNRTSIHHIDKLTTSCARVIGKFIEHAIEIESNHLNGPATDTSSIQSHQQPINLLIEPDWKTSIMDEWYDAIPSLYRRYALAQQALMSILLGLSPPPIPKKSKKTAASLTTNQTIIHSQALFQAIHALHRTYTAPLVQSQANLLLPSLLSLPTTSWFEFYDDYSHRFNLQGRFEAEFHSRVENLSFLEFCSDRELIGFIDLTMHVFGSWIMEKWLQQRESLITSRSVWRSRQESRQAGLESSDVEDWDPGLTEDVITEYDKQTSPVLIKWVQSLVMNCLPNSIHCKSARIQLNAISRLVFDSLMGCNREVCSKSDNYFLSLISITIESHRLVLFGLPMFNTGAIDQTDQALGWSSLHTPMRLQALIPKVITPLDQKIFNKAAKLFFRAHRSTRLLAILPGLLSTRHQPIIPGLDELLEFVIKGEYSIEFVAKSWVESLLKSDPKSWWIEADSNTTNLNGGTPSEEDDEARSKGAQDVRTWLENWLPILDQAEKLRSSLSDHETSEDNHDQAESNHDQAESNHDRAESNHDIDDSVDKSVEGINHGDPLEETKPQITCTCPPITHRPFGQLTIWEEDETKPNVNENPTNNDETVITAAENTENVVEQNDKETSTLYDNHHDDRIRVVVPATKKRRRKSSFLSLPSTRSKAKRNKSATPTHCFSRPSSSSRTPSINFDRPSPTNTCQQDGPGSVSRPYGFERAFHSSLFATCHHTQEKQINGNNVNDDNNDEDEDDDDEFDAMDLLVSSHRLKTPVHSSNYFSIHTSGATLTTNADPSNASSSSHAHCETNLTDTAHIINSTTNHNRIVNSRRKK